MLYLPHNIAPDIIHYVVNKALKIICKSETHNITDWDQYFDIIIVTGKHCMAIVVLAKEKRHQGSKVTASLLTQTLTFKILLFSSYQNKQTPEAATRGSEMRASTPSKRTAAKSIITNWTSVWGVGMFSLSKFWSLGISIFSDYRQNIAKCYNIK